MKTKPLQGMGPITTPIEELQSEPLTPEQQQQGLEALEPGQEGVASEQGATPTEQESPAFAQSQEPVAPAPPPMPSFVPLDTFAPLSPAVNALALAANQDSKSGDIEAATTTIERAIRIEPRNATLYYKLALLKLKQSNPRLAEDLAKKAALLASGDPQLKKHSWLLVARARDIQGDIAGAKEARATADKF
ncbi:MAG: tetratricopeptide repeat protein [Methylococcales bacterium]|nr:tetratricopeptide repeat protein [Methylococcales bacterium]